MDGSCVECDESVKKSVSALDDTEVVKVEVVVLVDRSLCS